MPATFLIYGTTGYTGNLIARMAVAKGLRPILAGRNAASLASQARELGLEYRAFSLDDSATMAKALEGVVVVLNCAGPFTRTSRLLAKGCLQSGTHYLDIAGEVPEFEALAALDGEAKKARIMLLPGAGFGVVPTDCLAVYLKTRLPSATRLSLAFQAVGGVSRGTVTTIMADLHKGGVTRRNGQLIHVPAAWKSRKIDLGEGPVQTVTNPWRGDLVTAFYSTGMPDIETYSAFPMGLRGLMKISRYLGWLLGSAFVQNLLQKQLQKQPAGPGDQERAAGKTLVWGEVEDATGHKVSARLLLPEAYTFTGVTALAIAERVLAGDAPAGFQTPGLAYGPDFILPLTGVVRVDESASQKVGLS